jgi:hypothetical protein
MVGNGQQFIEALSAALASKEMQLVSAKLGRASGVATWVFSVYLPDNSITTLHAPVKDGCDPYDVELAIPIAERAAVWWTKRAGGV